MEVPSIFLNRILAYAAKKNASNLHLAVGSLPMARIDDKLSAVEEESIVTSELIDKIIEAMANGEEKKKLGEDKEIVIVKELAGEFRFRINIFYQKNFPAINFHFIPSAVKGLPDLRLPAVLNNLIKLNSGLFIVAGSHGSGKTTTAAAIIEEVNKNYAKNIVTLEDPIEYLFIGKKCLVSQRQVGRDVKSATQGLKYLLEEDADLIYVGEIKSDFDAAVPFVLELAAGNSFVIWEINADSSARVIEKILNSLEEKISPEAARNNLADVLSGIFVQRLLPRKGGGLILANEVLFASGAVKSLIREGKVYQLESVIQTSKKEGMISMAKSIEELVKNGEVKSEDANGVRMD